MALHDGVSAHGSGEKDYGQNFLTLTRWCKQGMYIYGDMERMEEEVTIWIWSFSFTMEKASSMYEHGRMDKRKTYYAAVPGIVRS